MCMDVIGILPSWVSCEREGYRVKNAANGEWHKYTMWLCKQNVVFYRPPPLQLMVFVGLWGRERTYKVMVVTCKLYELWFTITRCDNPKRQTWDWSLSITPIKGKEAWDCLLYNVGRFELQKIFLATILHFIKLKIIFSINLNMLIK